MAARAVPPEKGRWLNGTFNGVEQKFKGALPQYPWREAPRMIVPEEYYFCNWMESALMADRIIIYGKVG